MKKTLSSIFVIVIALALGYQVLTLWMGTVLAQKGLSKEDLLKAIRLTPDNPEPFYKLSVYHQLNLFNIDAQESYSHLQKAIERNPLEQEYWLSLAKTLQRLEKKEESERALDNAIFVFPAGYQGRWTTANLLLQQGETEKAIPHFSYILAHYPNQRNYVYDVVAMVVSDTDFVLERIIPREPSAMNQYLSYLYEVKDKESAKKVWERKSAMGVKNSREEVLRHIEFLIAEGELSVAFQVWKARLEEEGLAASSDGPVTNGGFEKDRLLGGGFDWRMGTPPGAEISFDQGNFSEGKRSLKISFNGKENIDFQHVYQYVALKPNTDYVLKAHVKTNGVTTQSGLRIEISGVGSAFHGKSDSLTGDNAWREVVVPFRTLADSQGGLVRIRRESTNKFDRFISGVAWIDNVCLVEDKTGH